MPSKPQIADDGWTLSECGRYLERFTQRPVLGTTGTASVYECKPAPGYKDPNRMQTETVAQRKHREKQ